MPIALNWIKIYIKFTVPLILKWDNTGPSSQEGKLRPGRIMPINHTAQPTYFANVEAFKWHVIID